MKIGRTVVEIGLAACANVLCPIVSVYQWQGKLEEGRETALLLKTRTDLVDQVIMQVREMHSFACPCIVALPITIGDHKFLEWIDHETRCWPMFK